MPTFRQSPSNYSKSFTDSRSRLDGDEAYAPIAGALRRYSATSIAQAALQMLWAPYSSKMEALQTAPWHILLLVKWALQDPFVKLRVGTPISADAFDGLRQQVFDLVGLEHQRHPPKNMRLMLRSHLQQVDFQRAESLGFLRWPALIARQPSSQPSHRQFLGEIGLSPEHFMDLSYGLFAAVMNRQASLSPGWFDPMRSAYGPSIDAMWGLISRDMIGIRSEMQRAEAQKLSLRQELYGFPYLKRFPFIRLRNGRYQCWHPMVFARGMEDVVHLRLSGLQEKYAEPFSRIFEKYVIELTQAMDANAVIEDVLRKVTNGDAKIVEAAIQCGDCNVFVEAKMSLFADDVLLADNEVQAYLKTKRLRSGIKQAWALGNALRVSNSPLPAFAAATQDFLLLVTSRELFIGGGRMLQQLFREGDFDYPDEGAKRNLPLSNVFVLSIENFERLSCAIATGSVSLPILMKEAAAQNEDPTTSKIMFDDFVRKYIDRWGVAEILAAAQRNSEVRIAAAFGESPACFNVEGGTSA